jgi:DNA-binding NtrC family response regulator
LTQTASPAVVCVRIRTLRLYDYGHFAENTMPHNILVVDDDPDILHAAQLALASGGIHVTAARTPAALPEALKAQRLDAIVFDLNFQRGVTNGREGLRWLDEIRKLDRDIAVIVITAHSDVAVAVEAMKRGATDFVAKPWLNERLVTTVSNAIALCENRRMAAALGQTARELTRTSPVDAAMIGESGAMQHVRSLIARAAPSDANILILGENGTGKELVARALHRASKRADSPIVTVDLGAISPTLFESELFGHKKGAFTDAKTDRVGRFAAADRGTLFLDELGNLPLSLQPKLLSALEQRCVTPIGGNTSIAIDVRVVSATNLSREGLADERQLRPDLLFRLNTIEIHLPPLRERREDIAALTAHFVSHYAKKYGKPAHALSAAASDALCAYDWPGNVRALRHAVERAVILSASETLDVDDFALPSLQGARVPSPQSEATERAAIADSDDLNLDRIEKTTIERALKRNHWNISVAARDLGLTRASLYRRMERYGL